ncbi:MAG: hypothetical protein K6T86_17060 [Pirellulales bacterium]|nr:hypothetical protein [Pirellulales bacterium]
MSQATQPDVKQLGKKISGGPPTRVILLSHPKIVFLYPTMLMALFAAIYLSFLRGPIAPENVHAAAVTAAFLVVFATNLIVLSFDFPRTLSLTLFFLLAAIVMGLVLLFTLKPHLLPLIGEALAKYRPVANPTFFWSIVLVMGLIYVAVFISLQFDYWEVTPNELLHRHGFLANVERFPAPNMRFDKEITDVFEYFLLGSGRLIIQPGGERRAITLENVLFVRQKEKALTAMLGVLQVKVQTEADHE